MVLINGIASPNNAVYSGGEVFAAISPVVGSISSTSLFDFSSAYLNAAYYDNLAVTVEGLLNGAVLFSQTVTVSTSSALLVHIGFTGIDELAFSARTTATTSEAYTCEQFECTQFTLDNLEMGAATIPEPSSLFLILGGFMSLWMTRRSVHAFPLLPRWPLLLMLVCGGLVGTAQASESQPASVLSSAAPTPATAMESSDPAVSAQLVQLSATQFAEPLIATAPTGAAEDAALLTAIEHYRHRSNDDDYQALIDFLTSHPASGWQMSLWTNLGLSYYQAGRFSLAIEAWENAWRLGKDFTEPHAKALVDRALGELMRMHARIGHADRLRALFIEMGDRAVTGSATEAVAGARDGLWMMEHEPGISFLCGPVALRNLLLSQGATPAQVKFLGDYRSGAHGVSLSEVGRLATQAHLPHSLIRRTPGEAIPVPSVVHWKVSHYAAIIDERDGRYHIQDPIFGDDLWVTRDAIDSEASGYYLVPTKTLKPGWQKIQLAQADSLHGMGYTGSVMTSATTPQDPKIKPDCGSHGMCEANASEMTVSLNLNDTPVGYAPPKGPAVFAKLSYNQREAGQPANFGYFNVGSKWTLNWLSYIQDSPSTAGASVTRYVAGGGYVSYGGYNNGQFTPETYDNSVLVLTSVNPIRYERRLPDGSVEVYAQSNGATVAPRRIFLTQLIDATGNAATLHYDSQLRLTSITDATGRDTVFSYEWPAQPLLVTKISDPFGRSALLSYDNAGRLSSITDVIGLTSSFHYNASSLIDSMTTPYGTTGFAFGESGDYRWLEITDPKGAKERVEYRQQAPGIPYSESGSTIPQGIIAPFNAYINGRNTFYWDKQAYVLGAGDYTKARIKHWEHWAPNGNITSAPVESIKYPLENRIWFSYLGQTTWGAVSGTLDKPIRIGRVLDDGSTQLTQLSYNSLGNPTHIIDPQGRDTQIDYAANQIDTTRIAQKTAANSYTTIAAFTYNSQHLPLTYTDTAGQTTSYSYNNAGQLTQVKDALNQTTDYSYNSLGYLTGITNANGQPQLSLSYDSQGRIASRTDAEGHVLAYQYDDFDRLVQVTYPDGTVETTTWDKLDLASQTDREGRTTQYTHDAVRNLTAVTDPLNRTLQYGYYPNQTLKSLTDANSQTTTWTRDLQSRVTAKIYADGRKDTLAYEATTSRLKTVTDSLSQSQRYSYAQDNRPSKLEYLNAINATPSVTWRYDAWFPRLTGMTDGNGTTTYQYQAIGQPGALKLSQEDGPYTNDGIAYQYDALGRLTQRTIDTASETFAYDALGRTINHTSPLGSFEQSYLGETGQLTAQTLSGTAIGSQWQYDSNPNDRRLTGIVNSGASRRYDYITTANHIISQIQETGPAAVPKQTKSWTYAYDAADRLLQAYASDGAQYRYDYDPGDNLSNLTTPTASTNLTVNSVNQISSANGVAYSHDANGNVTDDGIRTYQWDAGNRLLKIGYKAQPARSTQFRYDGLGRRVAIVSNNGTVSTEFRYLWCGDSLCQARSATDVVARRYYPEGEVRPQGNTKLYYSRDHLGSVRDVLALPSGSRVSTYDYDAYGKPTQQSGMINPDFRYAGMFYLQEAGLYLTQYRVYDPGTGRWLSRDPIGETGGINLYGYVENDPINLIDPLGLDGVAAAQWARSQVGKPGYGYLDTSAESRGKLQDSLDSLGMRGVRSPKCNKFVWDALATGGDPAGRMSGTVRIAS